jgi:hypothetical protein
VVVHDAGVGRGGDGGDRAVADAVVATAEGRDHGILANAISPVAATRVDTRHAEPGELEPEQVAPGALFLAAEECSATGVVLSAAGGRFRALHWAGHDGVDFGREPVEPEQIAERWPDLAGSQVYTESA